MQKIYICDDNKIQLIKIKNIIQEEILKQDYDMKIEKYYTSSEEFLFDIVESKESNIYFWMYVWKMKIVGLKQLLK